MTAPTLYLGLAHDMQNSPRLPAVQELAAHTGQTVLWTATPEAVTSVIAQLHQSISAALDLPTLQPETRTGMQDMARDLTMRFDPLAPAIDQLSKTIARTLRFVQNLTREEAEFLPLEHTMDTFLPYLAYTKSPRLPESASTLGNFVIDNVGIDTLAKIVHGITDNDVLRMARITTGKVYLLLAEETGRNLDPAHLHNLRTLQNTAYRKKYEPIYHMEDIPTKYLQQ